MGQKALRGEKMDLTLLPEEILLYIANFLPFRDVIHISVTCKWMKYVLPRFKLEVQEIKGPDSSEDGAYAPHWNPLHYFHTPPLNSSEHWKFRCVQRLVISMKWNDPKINIKWPLKKPILSYRDKKTKLL